jgi:hypothetical protein
VLEFDPGVVGGELPVDGGLAIIAGGFPAVNLCAHGFEARNPVVETLALERAEFDFGHVEPTAVLRGVMKLEFLRQAPGFRRRKSRLE